MRRRGDVLYFRSVAVGMQWDPQIELRGPRHWVIFTRLLWTSGLLLSGLGANSGGEVNAVLGWFVVAVIAVFFIAHLALFGAGGLDVRNTWSTWRQWAWMAWVPSQSDDGATKAASAVAVVAALGGLTYALVTG